MYGSTALMASENCHLDIVRTLLEAGGDLNVKNKVRNQMMMMMIIILLTILIMMMMMMIVVINDEDGDDCR